MDTTFWIVIAIIVVVAFAVSFIGWGWYNREIRRAFHEPLTEDPMPVLWISSTGLGERTPKPDGAQPGDLWNRDGVMLTLTPHGGWKVFPPARFPQRLGALANAVVAGVEPEPIESTGPSIADFGGVGRYPGRLAVVDEDRLREVGDRGAPIVGGIEVGSKRPCTRDGFEEMWDGERWVPICLVCGDEAAYCDGAHPNNDLRARGLRSEPDSAGNPW